MEQIYQSSLLQALGWAIADSIWQMALLWLLYQVCIAIPIKNKPAVRHLGAVIALFAGGAWFLISALYKMFNAQSLYAGSGGKVDPTWGNLVEGLLPYLSAAYLVVLLVLLAKFAHAMVVTQRLRLKDVHQTNQWQSFVDEMALRFFIERKVWIQISEAIDVPATFGFLKPVILLPLASVNHLTVSQVEAIIMHELAHIKRHDYLINVLVTLVETILFFNPFGHLLSKQIRRECELCCDDAVLNHKKDPGQYAYALLQLEKSRQQYALAVAATGAEGLLLGRIKRILNQPEQKVRYRQRLLALVLVAGMIMGLTLLSPSSKDNADQILEVKSVLADGPVQFVRTIAPLPVKVTQPAYVKPKENSISPSKKPVALRALASVQESDMLWEAPVSFPVSEDMTVFETPIAPAAPRAPRPPKTPANTPAPPAPFVHPEPFTPAQGFPDLPSLVQDIRDLPRLIRVEGMQEKELSEIFSMMNAKDLKVYEQQLARAGQEMVKFKQIYRSNESQQKMAEDHQRVVEDQIRQHERIRQQSKEKMRVMVQGRKMNTAATPSSNGNSNADEELRKESDSRYRAYAYTVAPPKPRVKTFKDENGITISIVEDEQQIRIHFSNK